MATKLIKNVIKNILNPILGDHTKFYLKTFLQGYLDKGLFKDVNTYCMFIGSGRTGHSLVASLIDAHPNAIISNELNTLRFYLEGYGKFQLFSMILENSRKYAKLDRKWTGYSYFVANQMQGSFTNLYVIGDKKGGISTEILWERPDLLKEMMKRWNIRIKFIHVIRNPYDVISSMARGGQLKNLKVNKKMMEDNIRRFFYRMNSVILLKEKLGDSILDVHHELLIKEPKDSLKRILSFLDLQYSYSYLKDCSEIVNSSVSQSRNLVKWTKPHIEWVKKESEKYPFLKEYSFEEI